ncbi:hybrid sensor histidine kinase/response regulator [Candidatus Solirubrobacter pratensis]|uniref:hybrid sensor histidine kinase/response regulator n=1 Tax=Candidatus Solirubrobacter pratensis TaxID=1298857 RepID=UPI00041438E2|nr:ATP-binding protein [Candidatus Solirubrobacter pratensis]
MSVLVGLSVRTRFLLAAVLATLPLLCLVAYSAVDRYRADRGQAQARATNRAELFASLLAETGDYGAPTQQRLDLLFRLTALPQGASLVVFAGTHPSVRTGASGAGPRLNADARAALTRRSGVFTASGPDGVERVWGVHAIGRSDSAVAYGLPGAGVYGAARDALWRDLGFAALAALAALGAAYLAAGNVTRPIRRLAARVGGNGDGHELGRLERGFSRLGEAVETREAELARQTERLATLHAIDRAILDAETPEEVAGAALTRLRVLVGATHAQVVVLDRQAAGGISFVVGGGDEHALRGLDRLREGADEVYETTGGGGAYLAVPLRAEGELVGALSLGFPQPIERDDVREATHEVAAQIAIALRHARVRTELAAVLDAAMDAIVVVDGDRRFVAANAAASRLYGLSTGELIGRRMDDFVGAERAGRDFAIFLARGRVEGTWEGSHGGEHRVLDIRGTAEFRPGLHLFVLRDVTERRRLEAQLRQAQKMEAVGQLAGGIAHDFNNLLTVISGYGRLAERRIGAGPGAQELNEVARATERATQLTRQLLAFSRQQVLEPVILDVNEVVTGLLPMLDRLIGDDVAVAVLAADALPSVRADRPQLEQVIINLAINARDAMPAGGTLTFETSGGGEVCLAVTDTGVGMSRDVVERAFEPFFTIKETGQGTGLGLATVHGIVTQSGGRVTIYSEPGLGSTFRVYLPAVGTAGETPAPAEENGAARLGGSETILVCEDEDGVRMLIEVILRGEGYEVLSTAAPRDALELAASGRHVDALVSDVIMPEMSGPDLAQRLKTLRPGLRTLFISGYTAETVRGRGKLPLGSAFLEKPFDHDSLLRAVRALLDQPATSDL